MATSKDASITIELLEFDLESSSDDNSGDLLKNFNANNALKSKLHKKEAIVSIHNQNVQQCLRDYFQINSYAPLCGTLNQFSSLVDVQVANDDEEDDTRRITNLRFFSDDALTRRGFWIKIKGIQLNI